MFLKRNFLVLSLVFGLQNLSSFETRDQQSLKAILYADAYVANGYAADFIFTVNEVYYDDEGFDPMTLIILNDGSKWDVHPHYQYGPGPIQGMQIGIIPMTPDELPDFVWIKAHPFWLVMSCGNQQEVRLPVRRL